MIFGSGKMKSGTDAFVMAAGKKAGNLKAPKPKAPPPKMAKKK